MISLQTRRRMRSRFSAAARKVGMLQRMDEIRYLITRMRHSSSNRQFARNHPDFPLPPSHLAYDAYSFVDWEKYYDVGAQISRRLEGLIRGHLGRPPRKFLEWGCGPACVIRHMPKRLGEDVEIFGSDYNRETIAWCRGAIDGITFVENGLAPPLVFEKETFDCVCGLSVLTHLSDAMCRAWLEDLARVTAPNGILILTTKGDAHEYRLVPEEIEKLKNGEAVFRDNIEEGKRLYDTILPARYFKQILPDSLEVLLHEPSGMLEYYQDLWVLGKKA